MAVVDPPRCPRSRHGLVLLRQMTANGIVQLTGDEVPDSGPYLVCIPIDAALSRRIDNRRDRHRNDSPAGLDVGS